MKLQVYANEEDEKVIKDGCKLTGLNLSCFLRMSSVLHARRLIKENEEIENATN